MGTWTEDRITAACAWVVERLTADFKDTGLPAIEFRIDPAWQGGQKAGVSAPRPEDVILICGGHEFPLMLDGGVEQACWNASSQLQDDVIGERGRPWPELVDGKGEYVGVLNPPGVVPDIAHWQLAGEPFCAVGHLDRACEASGLSINL